MSGNPIRRRGDEEPAITDAAGGGPSAGTPSTGELRRIGLDAGLSAVGFTTADVLEPARSVLGLRREAGLAATMEFTYRNPVRSTDPTEELAGARSLVVGLRHYGGAGDPPRPVPGGPGDSPRRPVGRVARYARADHYGALRHGLATVADALTATGFRARVVADSNALVDRNAAWRAGLAAYGKNTNLLVPGAGSWYVVGAVITDAALPAVDAPVTDLCGPCTACLDGCPTGAIVAPGVLDARRCIAWLVQAAEPIPVALRSAVGDRIYGCDVCQEVCPPNRSASDPASDPAGTGHPADPGAWIDVLWLLSADDEALFATCGRWYIANRDPDVIRRTALIVLGNTADGHDPAVVAALRRYLVHDRALLRSHATWAARRLGRADLAASTRADPVVEVRAEWDEPVTAR
ncbi:MAG: tRNA epoxyqueuosine(34) reductase QueG [Acidimicrobiales bacterium]